MDAQKSLVPLNGTTPSTTMTSKEMADLTEKRHDSVKRSIDTLVSRGVIGVPQIVEYLDTLGRTAIEYRVGKRDSYVIVAQLSPEFTGRLVDRWQELEKAAAQTPLQIAQDAQARRELAGKAYANELAIAALFKVPVHRAQVEAVKQVKMITSVDLAGYLSMSPEQDDIPEGSEMLEVNDIAKKLGLSSGQKVNKLLAAQGHQRKTDEGVYAWVATGEGVRNSSKHQWTSGGKSGYNLKWNYDFVKRVVEQASATA